MVQSTTSDKLNVMFTWNDSPGCTLTPFFKSNAASFTCNLITDDPNLKLYFQIYGLPYKEIEFESIIPAFLEMVQNNCEIKLFKLDSRNDKVEFIGTNCSNVNDAVETDAFSQFSDEVEVLIRIMEKNKINLYLRDENFFYDLESKDFILTFTRRKFFDPFEAYYSYRYIDIHFQNGSDFKLNLTDDSVEFRSADLAGQSIQVRFAAQWVLNFMEIYNLNVTNLGLEISII